jgi:hypothetical protein
MNYFEQQALRRTQAYPTSQRAWDYKHDVDTRLMELGWQYGVPPGDQLCEINVSDPRRGQSTPMILYRDGASYPHECWFRPVGGVPVVEHPISPEAIEAMKGAVEKGFLWNR